MTKRGIDLFVSYCHRDKDVVHDIAGRLRAMGLRVFLDVWEIKYFAPLVDQLQDAIQEARAGLIFYSQYAAESRWVKQEYRSFIARSTNDNLFKILPVRLDDTELPSFLGTWVWEDLFPANTETIAHFVSTVARQLDIPDQRIADAKNGSIWTSQTDLSSKVFFTLKSLGLNRESFKPLWRVAEILRRGPQYPLRAIRTCECGGIIYCGYAAMGSPDGRDYFFHICDICLAHQYDRVIVRAGSSEENEIPCCPWCHYEWRPSIFNDH